jgi:hypothetical protein
MTSVDVGIDAIFGDNMVNLSLLAADPVTGEPSAKLFSLGTVTAPDGGGLVTLTLASTPPLIGGVKYWLLMDGAAPSTFISWNDANDTSVTPAEYSSNYGASGSFYSTTAAGAFTINAAVPEPSTRALLDAACLAGGVAAAVRRRRPA